MELNFTAGPAPSEHTNLSSHRLVSLIGQYNRVWHGVFDDQCVLNESLYGYAHQEHLSQRLNSLSESIHQRHISVVYSPFTLVPRSEPVHDDLSVYLSEDARVMNSHKFVFKRHQCSQYEIDVISAIPSNFIVEESGVEVEYSHFGYDFLEALPPNAATSRVYMTAFHDKMFVAVLGENGVKMLNSFDYVNKEGILYFLSLTFERLNLDQNSTTVYISGTFHSDGPELELLQTYFADIVLAQLIDDTETKDAHRFYPLYAVAGCV